MKYHRQRAKKQVSHADDWLMTYADVITLLLCLFAIIFSASMAKKIMPHSAIKAPEVADQIQQDDVQQTAEQPRPREQPVQPATVVQETKGTDLFAGRFPYPGLERMETPFITASGLGTSDNPPAAESNDVSSTDNPKAETAPASLHEIVDHLKTQGPASVEEQGDRITTIEVNSSAFFDSGVATLSNAGKAALKDVATNIKSDKFRDYQVTVEGHTDDNPIKTVQFPSNWELSTARASAVVHYFIDQGIPAQRLRAAGYADSFPKLPNRDAAGNPVPENQALNRRVVIKMEKIDRME